MMHNPLSILRVRAGFMPAGYCGNQNRWVPIKIHSHRSGKERIVCVECFTPIIALKDSLSGPEVRSHRDYVAARERQRDQAKRQEEAKGRHSPFLAARMAERFATGDPRTSHTGATS